MSSLRDTRMKTFTTTGTGIEAYYGYIRPRQMRGNKRNKRGRNKTALHRFLLSFNARSQTNVVSGALIELPGNKKLKCVIWE